VALDSLSPTAIGDLKTVFGSTLEFSNEQLAVFLQDSSGSSIATNSQIRIQGMNLFGQALGSQIRSSIFEGFFSLDQSGACTPFDSRKPKDWQWRTWTMGYGSGGSAETDGNAAGVNFGLGGVAAGFQKRVTLSTTMGFFGGYSGANVTGRESNFSIDTDSSQFGGFLFSELEQDYYLAIGGIGFSEFESARSINVGSLNRTAFADYTGWQGFGYFERGKTINVRSNAVVQPYVGLQHSYLRRNGIRENNAGALSLGLEDWDTHSLRGFLGGRLRVPVPSARWKKCIIPEVRLSWVHELLETGNSQLTNIGGADFTSTALDLGKGWGIAGAGLRLNVTSKASVNLDYDVQFNRHQDLHIGSVHVSIRR